MEELVAFSHSERTKIPQMNNNTQDSKRLNERSKSEYQLHKKRSISTHWASNGSEFRNTKLDKQSRVVGQC